MITRQQQAEGTGLHARLRTYVKTIFCLGGQEVTSVVEGQDQDTFFDGREEFLANSATVPGGKTDYSPTGTPSFAIIANAPGGWISATLAADNAAMLAGASWDDNLQLRGNRYFCVEHRLQFPVALTTAQRALIGVAGAIETGVNPGTLAGLICGAFLLDASMVLKCLTRNGGTVTETHTSGRTLTADKPYWFKVELDQTGTLNYYLGEQYGEDGSLIHSVQVDFGATQCFQPIALLGKSEGTTVPVMELDTSKWRGHRDQPVG